MPNKNSIINIFAKNLPGHITIPMCREYDWRKTEIQRILDGDYVRYKVLVGSESTIDALLALSLFYRYVIAKLDGTSEFYDNVNKKTNAETSIQIGKFVLDQKERNRLLAVHIQFKKIVDKFQIPNNFFNYADTMDFLVNCIALYYTPEQDGENNPV